MPLPSVDAFTTYGGPKQNRQAPANALFDYDALQLNQAFSDTAGMTHTAWRAVFLITLGSYTSSTLPTLVAWDATWKLSTPTTPILANTAIGNFTITLPASVTDENGQTTPLNFFGGVGGCTALYEFFSVNVSATVNVISVAVGTQAGGTSDLFVGQTIFVGVR